MATPSVPTLGRVRWAPVGHFTSHSGGTSCSFTSHSGGTYFYFTSHCGGTCFTFTSHSGGTTINPGAAWVATLPRQEGPLPGPAEGTITTSSMLPVRNRFPSTPAGVLACSDWSSTKWPACQRRRPSHLDLYTEVWGEPCGEEHSAAVVQQQHQVAPATREPLASHLQLLSASCYWEEEGSGGSLLLHPLHPARSGQ